jgi:RNA polymerase sigma-70 factor (ECF subfamily)
MELFRFPLPFCHRSFTTSSPMGDPKTEATQHASGAFATTHWSVVLAAADSAAPGSHEALEQLCRTYWRPVYTFVRRQGHSPDDALDLTQGFFARFLERKQVKLADRVRGQLRTFLLVSLKSFLANEWSRGQAKKRGGGHSFISLEEQREAETRLMAEPADPAAPPDQAFEKRRALTLLDQVLSSLRDESAATGGQEHFDALKVFVWGDQTAVSQVEVASRLGMTPNALGVAVHRLRRRFGELLRVAIARTVVGENEIEAELRHLIKVISS